MHKALLLATALLATTAQAAESPRQDRTGSAFGAYLVGRFALQTHDPEMAATQLERALQEDPAAPDLRAQAFLAALLSGQSAAARLANRLPDNPLAQLTLGDQAVKAGRWFEAETLFAALSNQQPATAVLRPILVAWAQQGEGRTDQALSTLAPLANGTRLRGVYALHAAMIADVAGRVADATKYYDAARVELRPLNLRLGMTLASWKARHGQVDAAQAIVDELIAGDADLGMARQALKADVATKVIRGPADGIAEAYLALAATLREQSAESALVMLRLALDLRPNLTAARLLLAEMLDSSQQPDAALALLNPVAAADPLAPLVALRRGALLAELNQTDAAAQIFDRLAREHPGSPEPLAAKADMLRRKDQYAAAAEAYSAAIARLGTPNRANWPLYFARGIALERAGQWPRAEQDFRDALELAPDQPSVMNYLAYSWAERGEHLDDARAMLERAVQARPNEGAIVDSLGYVLLRLGDAPGAVTQLNRAVELQPEDPVINGHLGDALAAAGRTREAEFQWRRALNLKPEEKDRKALEEKLNDLPKIIPAKAQ